jgi:hypothetical protein
MKSLLLAIPLLLASLFGTHSPTTPAPAITTAAVVSSQPSSALPGVTSTESLPASFAHSAAASSAQLTAAVAEGLQSDEAIASSLRNYLAQQLGSALYESASAWSALASLVQPHLTATVALQNIPAPAPVMLTAAVADSQPTSVAPLAVTSSGLRSASSSAASSFALPIQGIVLGTSTQVGYVTQDELAAAIDDLSSLIHSLAPNTATNFTDPQIAANGNGVYYGATAAPVVQLANVTVSNISGLTASEIPALNYFPATSTVDIAYGGTGTSTRPSQNELMLSDALGNWEYVATSSLGIGGALSLSGTAGQLAYFNSSNSAIGTSSIFIASNGNLGIGTTSPVAALSLVGNAYFTGGLGIGVVNTTAGTLNGWKPEWGVLPSSGGAPSTGGAGYAVGDSVTLNAGCSNNPVVTVNAVSGGSITAYDVVYVGVCSSIPANPITQLSSTGSGSGATFSFNWGPVAAWLDSASLSNGNGDLYIGGNLSSGYGAGEVAGGMDYGSENTFVGIRAGGNATSGSFNTALGHNAFGIGAGVAVTGTNDVAIGTDSMRNSTSTTFSIAIGANSMHDGGVESTSVAIGSSALFGNANANGSDNVAIGSGALSSSSISTAKQEVCIGRSTCSNVTTASNDIAIGENAMINATSTSNSIAIGSFALQSDGTVSSTGNNVAIGGSAMIVDSSGFNNVAVGINSMQSNTTGSGNTALGLSTLNKITTASDNVAVGQSTGSGLTGTQNTIVGSKALTASGSAGHDTIFGYQAGSLLTGNNNIFFGWNAASSTVSGGNNIAIGYDVGLPSVNGSNQLDIGNLIFGTGVNGEATNISSGDIAIGTTTPYARLSVWGSDSASSTLAFNVVNSASTTVFAVFDGGNAQLSGTLTQSSDQRLKTNIQSLDGSSSLSLIDELNPVTFTWINPDQGTTPQSGFIAQQVQQVFPNLVSTTSPTALTPNGTLGLNYIGLISPIVSAIQDLSGEVQNLIAEVQGFAQSFTSQTVTATNELCVGLTCVTAAQFEGMVAAYNGADDQSPSPSGQSQSAATSTPESVTQNSDATDTPPQIQNNGDNPAIIQVGDSYADLGATITGPSQDLNLDIATFLNGLPMNSIVIDTSAPATDTIDYVVTDQNDLTSTSTRTVIIEAEASSTAQ